MKNLILIIAILLLSSVNALVFTVTEGELVKLKLKAYDPDGNSLTYNFTSPLNENGEWQTKVGDAGTYNIVVTVSDGEKVSKEGLTLIVNPKEKVEEPKEEVKEEVPAEKVKEEEIKEIEKPVEEINHPPKLENIKDITITEGELVKISPIANDEDNDEIKYGFAYPINEKGEWQTKSGDMGEYIVTVTATDQKSVDSKTFKIIVKKKERKISFEQIKDIEIKENEEVNLELKASAEGEIEYSAENLPEGATLSGNKFYFKPGYDYVGRNLFINLLDKIYSYVPKKSKTVIFIAKSNDEEKKKNVKITVKDVNRIPKLEINDLTLNEGEKIKFNIVAKDDDGDWLKTSYSGDLKNNYQTNFDDAGTYNIKVTLADPFDSVSKDIKVVVNDVKKKNAPSLSPLDLKKINEGEELSFKVSASDPDKDKLSYYILEGPGTINGDIFSWTPGYDFVKKKKKQDLISKLKYFNKKTKNNKEIEVKIGVSDGNLTDNGSFKVIIYDVNQKPEIVNFEPEDNIIVAKGGRVVFSVDVNDLDNDELIYTWNFGFMNNLKAENTIARTFTKKGKKTIKVTISDGVDEVEKSWNVKVI